MQHRRTSGVGRGLLARVALAAVLLALPSASFAQDKVYGVEELTTKPKVANTTRTALLVSKSYPDKLKSAGVDGTVEVQFVVGPDGKVEPGSIEVLAASVPAFGDAAREVAAKLEFQPGKVNDAPVRARVMLPIIYKAR